MNLKNKFNVKRIVSGLLASIMLSQAFIYGDGTCKGLLHTETINAISNNIEIQQNKQDLIDKFEQNVDELKNFNQHKTSLFSLFKNDNNIQDDFNDEEKAIDQYLELLTPTYTEKLISEGKIKGTQYASVEEIKDELNNLYYTLKNIDDMAKIAFENGETAFEYTGASEKHYSFVDGRTVANCAEIWAVRNAILKGAKLKNLIFRSQYFGNTTNQFADPCDNCKKTFNNNWVLSDNEIYKPSNKFNISIGDSD